MKHISKSQLNVLQNLIISFLSVSALTLFLLLQLDFRPAELLSALFPSENTVLNGSSPPGSPAPPQNTARLAVSGDSGRQGRIHLTTGDDGFAGAGNLLQEALGSAGVFTASSEADFRAALERTSLYCDWTVPLPLSVSGGLLGATVADAPISPRRMVLSAEEDAVTLCLTDDTTFLSCTTKVSADSLRTYIDGCQLPGVTFAWELDETATDRYTLLPTGDLPEYPRLASRPAAQPAGTLLSALGFNPNTNSRYTESNGTEVIRDGSRTLRVETDGTLVYDSGGSPVPELTVPSGEQTATAAEAAFCSSRLLSSLLADSEAQLCLQGAEPTDTGWLVTFAYQINGVPIRFGSGETAALAEISGTDIVRFSVCLRSYSATETPSLLLPLRQVLAVAALASPGDPNISYVDGGSTADAAWLTD